MEPAQHRWLGNKQASDLFFFFPKKKIKGKRKKNKKNKQRQKKNKQSFITT